MITFYDNASLTEDMQERYRKLFNSAYNDLKKSGDDFKDLQPFVDLSDYYSHMGDYMSIGKPIYILLPLEEEYFAINANTRKIEVPKAFDQCGGITNDNLCELFVFTIDRYFDYTDLLSSEIKINVKWKNALGEEGYTNITELNLIDADTYFEEGKIRFGWPLSKQLTKKAGKISFSVEFYTEDSLVPNKKSYILNTLPATVTIHQGLDIDLETAIPDTANFDLNQVVHNSVGMSNMPLGVHIIDYSWRNPDITPESEKIDKEDTLTLSVESFTLDNVDIDYEWYRAPWQQDLQTGEWKINSQQAKLITSKDEYYTIATSYVEYKVDRKTTKFPMKIKLYTTDNSLYTGNDWPADNVSLYRKYSTLTINKVTAVNKLDPDHDITGKYYVVAINKKMDTEDPDKVLGVTKDTSAPCFLYRPDELAFKTNLPESKILPENGETISVDFVENEKNPSVTHLWKRFETREAAEKNFATGGSEIEGSDGDDTLFSSSREIDTAGYYQIKSSSELNRMSNDIFSNICKITKPVTSPWINTKGKFTYTTDSAKLKDIETWKSGATYEEIQVTTTDAEISNKVNHGNLFILQINAGVGDPKNTTENKELLTDGLTYKWFYSKSDSGNWTPIDEKIVKNENSLVPKEVNIIPENNFIILRCVWNDGEAYSFKCEVTNTLAGETKTATTSNIIIYNVVD